MSWQKGDQIETMPMEKSLQGWVPELGENLTIARVIALAFDYRGNTTIVKTDGNEVVGYISNQNNDVPEPYIQWFDKEGNGPFKMLCSEIQNIKFTGKDTAAGKSWVARRDKEKAANRKPATQQICASGDRPISSS